MKNLGQLQRALEGKGRAAAPAVAPVTVAELAGAPPVPRVRATKTVPRAPSREGKVMIGAWMSPDYKGSLRLIQARRETSIQELLGEALNMLFERENVPTVRKD
jgi:hypothetical protein